MNEKVKEAFAYLVVFLILLGAVVAFFLCVMLF